MKFADGIPSDTIAFVNAFKVMCFMPSRKWFVCVFCAHLCPYFPGGYLFSTARHGTQPKPEDI